MNSKVDTNGYSYGSRFSPYMNFATKTWYKMSVVIVNIRHLVTVFLG